MRRAFLFALLFLAIVVACARLTISIPPSMGGTILIEAQTLPIVKAVAWDALPDPCAPVAPITCPVLTYTVTLDNVVVGTVSAATLTQSITITTTGPHAIGVSAANVWGSGSPGILNMNVQVPGKPQPRLP